MPYININEYDYTVTGPKTINDNIVAVPINAADGPSDKWITIHTYEDFIQMFGGNPSAVSTFGNSWEYAANLLLRGMSVCVRRITHVLDEEGNNDTQLEGVNIAKAVIKVEDVIGGEIASNSLSEGIITLTDAAKNSILNSSNKGTDVLNPLYKYCTYEKDGETEISEYPDVNALEKDTDNQQVGAFADVLITNSEWDYIGETANPHYKYKKLGDDVTMSEIYKMNQTIDEQTNKEYELGDFFIEKDSGHIIIFSPTPIRNQNWINVDTVYYPDQLKRYATDTTLTKDNFIDVSYDENNEEIINNVWVYSEKGTDVANHFFINGTKEVTINETLITVFEKYKDLPTDKPLTDNYFAAVKDTNDSVVIWKFNSQADKGKGAWSRTSIDAAELTKINSEYSIKVHIPFECTGQSHNTDIYKHQFYWKNTGNKDYYDEKHPEFVYVTKIHWKNSNREIGTTDHVLLSGAKLNINDIVINTTANTSKSSISLYINGHKDIKIDEDFTDTRLISGTYGITNISKEPIKIYGFRIARKSDNGDVSIVYDAGIEKINDSSDRIIADPLLRVYDTISNTFLTDPIPLRDNINVSDKYYIELNPGCMIYYNTDITNGTFNLKVAGFDNFKIICHTFNSTRGSYDITLSATKDEIGTVTKWFIPKIVEDETIDYNDIPIRDAQNNFNLFTMEYNYPGSNGNFLNTYVKTIPNQGIYVYVHRNQQFLERIELCSFRFRNGNSGRVATLDMELNKDAIWRTVLAKFGILLLDDGKAYDSNLNLIVNESAILPIYGTYVKLSLNKNIVLNGDITSLDYLNSIYAQTGGNIIKLSGGSNPDDEHVLHEVYKSYIPLKDKYKYDITFVSNGGYIDEITYPKNVVNELATDTGIRMVEDGMIELATARKDCIAFLDVPFDLGVEMVPYYFEHISTSYAAAYDPWAYIILATGATKWMPPSFVQLYTHAKSILNGNKMYLPPAGVRRALVPEILKTNHDLSHKYMTAWQDETTNQFVNPIIWINGYDYTIYGQKTLYNIVNESDRYQSALQDLNVRLVANEIKKLIFKTCIDLTFELNNIMTWNEFKSKIEPTLSVMLGEGVLSSYDILMGSETMTVADLNSGHVVGTVKIAVTRAATDWDINFELSPNGAVFTEYDYNSQYIE